VTINFDTLILARGSHDQCDDGSCLMEARTLLLGLPKTDARQPGVSRVLHGMGINLNDSFPDDRRQELKRFLPHNGIDPLADTDDGRDEQRSYMALDWLIRTYTPAFLELRPELADVAAELRGLRRIVDMAAAQEAGPVVRAARDKSAAARAAAREAAWDAARAAARAAGGGAARAAARAAAGGAARAAAWEAAWDAARAAARAAARDAAWAAARAAAWDAAWAAARDVLQPTVHHLQTSAIELYAAMIDPTSDTLGGAR